MPDLDSADEVAVLVRRFYGAVAQDDLLGPVFEGVAQVDWAEHLPKLVRFWCSALLGERTYDGNPFAAHAAVHRRAPLTAAHFARWLELFHDAVEERWSGPGATRALALAEAVGRSHREQLLGRAPRRLLAVRAVGDPPERVEDGAGGGPGPGAASGALRPT